LSEKRIVLSGIASKKWRLRMHHRETGEAIAMG
jgi:hypothetical protein